MQTEIAVVVAVTAYKLSCLGVGALFCVLGYRLFLQGVVRASGQLDAKIVGAGLTLKSAAPGTFFSVLGAAIVVFTVLQGINFNWQQGTEGKTISTEKPVLPPAQGGSSTTALASPDSDAYKRAAEAYNKGDYQSAVKLLKEYKGAYVSYLDGNAALKEAVEKAIAYSERRLGTTMTAGGVKVVPVPPPQLP